LLTEFITWEALGCPCRQQGNIKREAEDMQQQLRDMFESGKIKQKPLQFALLPALGLGLVSLAFGQSQALAFIVLIHRTHPNAIRILMLFGNELQPSALLCWTFADCMLLLVASNRCGCL